MQDVSIYTISWSEQPSFALDIMGNIGPMDCFHTVYYRKYEEACKKTVRISKLTGRKITLKLRKVNWLAFYCNCLSMEYFRWRHRNKFQIHRLREKQTDEILATYKRYGGSLKITAALKEQIIDDIDWAT